MATKTKTGARAAAKAGASGSRAKSDAKKTLTRYREKRDFTRTPEPSGDPTTRPKTKAGKLATLFFCVQKHLASHLHYDFRLEHRGVLLSWAVPKGPSLKPADKRLAMRVEDHPFDYRHFEGVIPEGYGAGVVMLWDEGKWAPEEGFEDVAAALREGELKFRLEGVKLKGSWVMVRTGPPSATGEREHWLLIKHRDEWAGDVDVTAAAPNSVKSDRDFEGIIQSNPSVWKSNRPATADLQKIVDKVMALEGKGPRRKPGAKSEKPAPRRAQGKRGK